MTRTSKSSGWLKAEDGWGVVLRATVTPLASIFGSGFLIIVPVLERTVGPYAVFAITGVCLVAWLVGNAIRRVISEVEPRESDGSLDAATRRLERLSDFLIAVAYVISVALYLRIMAQYIAGYAGVDSTVVERSIASGAVLLISLVGIFRGFQGLETMERLALGAVLVLATALGTAFFISDAGQVLGGGLSLPPVPGESLAHVLLVLGGILITVQGFETVLYTGETYDGPVRIRASRVAQLLSTSIYLGFVAVCTPLMGLGTGAGFDRDLLDVTERIVPALTLPLVLCAVFSQFSAATADTEAASGNMHTLFPRSLRGPRPYVLGGAVAIVLAWTVPTLTIIAVASRAFAAFYCVQCVVAARTATRLPAAGFYLLALLMAAVALLAEPAG